MKHIIFFTILLWFLGGVGVGLTENKAQVPISPSQEEEFLRILALIKNPFVPQLSNEESPKEETPKAKSRKEERHASVQQRTEPGRTVVPLLPFSQQQPAAPVVENAVIPPSLSVQGLVWGKEEQQAIVENQIVAVGDTVKEAKIVSISREGVRVLYQGVFFNFNIKE